MTRGGRKRKAGGRYPSGERKPDPKEFAPPAVVRRILDQARTGAGNPLLGSVVGGYRLTGKIDDKQLAAASLYADLVVKWHRVQGIALPFPPPATLEVGRGRGETAADDPEVVDSVNRAFNRVSDALRATGKAAEAAVADVAVMNRHTPDMAALRRGLAALVVHFHVGEAEKK